MSPQAGWYPDPAGVFDQRYWGGEAWTAHVHVGGRTASSSPDVPVTEARELAEQLRAAVPDAPPPQAPLGGVPAWPATPAPAAGASPPQWDAGPAMPAWAAGPSTEAPKQRWVVPVVVGAVVLLVGVGLALATLLGRGTGSVGEPDVVSGDGPGAGVSVFDLAVGTCFDDVPAFANEGGGGVEDVPVVDCDRLHDNEVFAVFNLEGRSFPGDDGIHDRAESGCLDRFEPYVGRDYASSRFLYSHLVPTADSWEGGDREIVCFLYDIDLERLRGSMRGSGE